MHALFELENLLLPSTGNPQTALTQKNGASIFSQQMHSIYEIYPKVLRYVSPFQKVPHLRMNTNLTCKNMLCGWLAFTKVCDSYSIQIQYVDEMFRLASVVYLRNR